MIFRETVQTDAEVLDRETVGSVGDDLLIATSPELLHNNITAFCRENLLPFIFHPLHVILLSKMTLKNTSSSSSEEEAT